MNNTLKIILSIFIFAKKIQPENLETGSGGALEGRDYHSNDYNNDYINDDNNDHDNGDDSNFEWVFGLGNIILHLLPYIVILIFYTLFDLYIIRLSIFDCHLPSFFGSRKAIFPKPENQMKYNTRLALRSSTPVFIRNPMTNSISFELMSVKYDRLILRGCSTSLPKNVREITICLPHQAKAEGIAEGESVSNLYKSLKMIDEHENVLAMSIPTKKFEKSKITTNSLGLNFREHIVSWDNDTLKLNYQGVDVMVMVGLSSFFMTPLGKSFFEAPAQMAPPQMSSPMGVAAPMVFAPAPYSMNMPAVLPAVNNFLITDVFVCNFHNAEGGDSPCCALDSFCGKFMFGNMQKSKWGFQTESQFV
jgi:hypothetical protein